MFVFGPCPSYSMSLGGRGLWPLLRTILYIQSNVQDTAVHTMCSSMSCREISWQCLVFVVYRELFIVQHPVPLDFHCPTFHLSGCFRPAGSSSYPRGRMSVCVGALAGVWESGRPKFPPSSMVDLRLVQHTWQRCAHYRSAKQFQQRHKQTSYFTALLRPSRN